MKSNAAGANIHGVVCGGDRSVSDLANWDDLISSVVLRGVATSSLHGGKEQGFCRKPVCVATMSGRSPKGIKVGALGFGRQTQRWVCGGPAAWKIAVEKLAWLV
ncbi:MAG: hypothetical protein N3B01_05255 [Verrucomicrobiae bacterium]|nr:hypothetical protein [Verrucomicrobiae bacterium]